MNNAQLAGGYVLDAAQMFTLFFITLGPLKLLGPFAQATRELDLRQLRSLAWKSAGVALAALVLGGLLGRSLMGKWMVPPGALQLTAGIIFFLVALQGVMAQYQSHAAVPAAPAAVPAPAPGVMKIAFPMLVTPYGIAAVILLLVLSHDIERALTTLVILALVMLLNLLSMMWVRAIMRPTCVAVLQVAGAVLGVMQVALAVAIMLGAARVLGLFGLAPG